LIPAIGAGLPLLMKLMGSTRIASVSGGDASSSTA